MHFAGPCAKAGSAERDNAQSTSARTPLMTSSLRFRTTPAAFGRHPSLRKEGKRPSRSFPSSHEEGRPRKRAGWSAGWSAFPFVLALVFCSLSLSAQAQSRCLVLDPELQDSYSGGC